ncbi:MAG TPA: dihydroxyacetone kinase subunit DhaL [Terriglobales bacterium]|nr:dihydroxyacetone kinase subunit DhaL [Terriglobales bacterium]
MDSALLRQVIERVCQAVIARADHLTDLDQAIGDGDHGVNMKRGCEAVLAEIDSTAAKPLPEALRAIGTQLVMTVGGASGPLYGTLFLTLGKELPAEPDQAAVAKAVKAALAAVQARGKSERGQKTLLDVLGPVSDALSDGGFGSLPELVAIANQAAAATVPLQATRGRASFLGERSIGHMDPGACSLALIIETLVATLEGLKK